MPLFSEESRAAIRDYQFSDEDDVFSTLRDCCYCIGICIYYPLRAFVGCIDVAVKATLACLNEGPAGLHQVLDEASTTCMQIFQYEDDISVPDTSLSSASTSDVECTECADCAECRRIDDEKDAANNVFWGNGKSFLSQYVDHRAGHAPGSNVPEMITAGAYTRPAV